MMAITANFGFKLASVDIRAVLDRDILVEPPTDIKKPGLIWKLKKPSLWS